jgi:hypothetical protein
MTLLDQGLHAFFSAGQAGAVIDTFNFLPGFGCDCLHSQAAGSPDRYDIRQVIFRLFVIGANLFEGTEQEGCFAAVNTGVDFIDQQLLIRGIPMLNNGV